MTAIQIGETTRGFAIGQSLARYGAECTIPKSSLAEEDCIWLGVDSADPKIRCNVAREPGLTPPRETGWMDFPIPAAVSMNTRMHLTREMAAALIPVLQHSAKTGELPSPPAEGAPSASRGDGTAR